MNRKVLTITLHVAAWTCFFLLPLVFFRRPRESGFQYNEALIQMFVCLDAFLVIFYYLNSNFLIPRFLTNRKWLWYAVAIVVCFAIYAYIPRLFEAAIQADLPENVRARMQRRQHKPLLYPFTGSSAVFFLVFTVSTCTRVIQEWLDSEKKKQEIENEKLATELSFLRSQVNPHFLFNTLNNIYSMALVKSDATADAVLKLSSIMRYVLSETKHDIVPLDKEIQFIKHYIELQKVRLTNKVSVEFLVEGETEDKQIAPLLLIPFVENAFKYGISTKELSQIVFKVSCNPNTIRFTSNNRIVSAQNETPEKTGIGLKNTRRRLELLYPEKHKLIVNEESNHFIIDLTLYR